jgi:hypothetical protein
MMLLDCLKVLLARATSASTRSDKLDTNSLPL